MLKLIRSLFASTTTTPRITYPLKDLEYEDLDIKFSDVHKVIAKKGYMIETETSVHKVMDTYEKKKNKPNVLTMKVYSPPNVDVDISFENDKQLICIKRTKNSFKQKEGRAQLDNNVHKVMIDTNDYKSFCIE